jgi:nitrate reductase NapE component
VTRRALWALCGLAVIWAFATALTGGVIVHVGEWRLSSRGQRNPLMLAMVSGLLAWRQSRKDGRNEGLALWTWCQARIPVVLAVAAAFELVVLIRPTSTWLFGYGLGEPDVFAAPPPLKRFALPLLSVFGIGVLSVAASKGLKLVAHPRRTVAAVFVMGLALHLAMIGSLKQGFPAFAERAISSGHGDFLHQAVTVEDLGATLEHYEPYARQYLYLSVKGPGILLFFRGLNIVANSTVLRPLLDLVAPSATAVRPWLINRGVAPGSPHAEQKVEEMRYLLALMFVLFPVLTFLPVFLIFWVGRTFVDETFGLLAATTYIVTPEASLSIAHLDYALYPLLAIGTVAAFVIGVRQHRLGYVVASAVAFMLYFTITLAAVSVVVMLIAYLGCDAWQRIRRRDSIALVTIDMARVLGVFGLVCGLALTSLYFGIHFHPIERYGYAREVQRDWVTSEYNLFWVVSNALGYFLSFGLVQTALLIVQLGRSARRVVSASGDGIALLAVAWLCLLLMLLAFGRQHGETNRLWTFLSPVGCLIVARYIYDVIPSRRWWLPMLMFFVSLVLMRYRLNYF